ncbi:MAG: PIN domain-containing protein [Pelagimonas sp.]|jgi:predicted nucleic acid-binding protein|nr:PIN domain-containing protein [Pelagimonas sp.]
MKVLLDTCVLFPTVMREALLGVAGQGLFEPLWSERILEEWARAARKIGPEGETIARGEIAMLQAHWPRAAIQPHAAVMARLYLPDENDVHVLAAAISGHADALITVNIKDFPKATLAEEGIERITPDAFLIDCFARDPDAVLAACGPVLATAIRLSGHPWTMRSLFKKARLPRLGKALDTA